jgi:hypothetical protein
VTSSSNAYSKQMTASFKRGTVKGAVAVDEADLGSITLTGSRTAVRKGTFVSGVLDAQAMVDWERALLHAEVPSGSKLVVSVRTGSMLKPDETWSSWRTVSSNGQITGSSRHIQHKLKMTSSVATAPPVLMAWDLATTVHRSDRSARAAESSSTPSCQNLSTEYGAEILTSR